MPAVLTSSWETLNSLTGDLLLCQEGSASSMSKKPPSDCLYSELADTSDTDSLTTGVSGMGVLYSCMEQDVQGGSDDHLQAVLFAMLTG